MGLANSVFADDLLLYRATAREYGEDGEVVNVQCFFVPSHLQNQIGQRVHLRLEYDSSDTVSGWYRLEETAESIEEDAAVLRFVSVAE